MSLINKMLKDLESRKSDGRIQQHFKSLISTVSAQEQQTKSFSSPTTWVVIAALMVFIVIAFQWDGQDTELKVQAKIPSIESYVPEFDASDDQADEQVAHQPESSRLTPEKVTFEKNTQQVTLRFSWAKEPTYKVEKSKQGTTWAIVFHNVELSNELDYLDFDATPVSSLMVKSVGDESILRFGLKSGTEVELSHDVLNTVHQLEIVFKRTEALTTNKPVSNQQTVSASTQAPQTHSPVKKVVAKTPQEEADELYYEGLQLAHVDQFRSAINKFNQSLERLEEHHLSRVALVQALLKQQKVQEAEQLLNEAIALWPAEAGYIKLKSRLMMQRQDYSGAMRLLEKEPPSLMADPEYHAMMAALHQHLNDPKNAISKYQQVLSRRPEHGPWQLGYAIALERDGQYERAYRAYQHAYVAQGLNEQTRDYIKTRMTSIKSIQSQ